MTGGSGPEPSAAGGAVPAPDGGPPPARAAARRRGGRAGGQSGGPASAESRLLAVAAEHLRRLGPGGLTVVGVAAAAGMTHANVYRYFPSRGALVDAVAGRWLREVEAALAGIADAPDPADDKLERLILALARAQRRALGRDPHVFAVHRDATASARPLSRRHRARLRTLIEGVIDAGLGAQAFDLRDRDRGVAFVFDVAHRFTHPVCLELDAEMPADLWEARLAAVLRAMLRTLRSGLL